MGEEFAECVDIFIFNGSTVWLNHRIRVQGRCTMGDGFANFPLDTQRCFLVLESCGYSIAEVRLSWLPWNPVSLASERLQLPDFRFVNLSHESRLRRYAAGAFDQLKVTFHFKRLYGYYVVQASPNNCQNGNNNSSGLFAILSVRVHLLDQLLD